MRTGILLAVLPVVFSAGCMHNARTNQQLLERELRLQEDCIYKLKWQLEDAQRELEATREQANTLRREADTLRDRTGDEYLEAPSAVGPSGGGEAPRLPPAPSLPPLPTIERGTEVPPSNMPTSPPGASLDPPELRAPLAQAALAAEPNPLREDGAPLDPDAAVDRIVINPKLTGGLNADGKPGDEILSVAIDQRDASDAEVLAPGDVAIVVIDPAIPGKAARIARWDIEAEKLSQYVRRDGDGGALRFELPWPKPPQHDDLQLYVRFTTYDGRRLQANLPIEVQPPRSPRGGGDSPASLASHEEDDVAVSSPADKTAPKIERSIYEQSDTGQTDEEDEEDAVDETATQRTTVVRGEKRAAEEPPREPPKWSPDRR